MVMINAADTVLQPQLKADEHILWSGMPRQGLCLRSTDAMAIPFSLFWGGFAFYWEYMALTGNGSHNTRAPAFMVLWGIPFCLIGIYLIVGRFFYDNYRRARTYYAVTNQRIIIVSGGLMEEVKSLSPDNPGISVSARPDGSGTILFGFGVSSYGMAPKGTPRVPSFDMIADAQKVYDLIMSVRDKKTA